MKYSKEFKDEAVSLSDEIGVKEAVKQLGIPYNTLMTWRQIEKNPNHRIKEEDTETISKEEYKKLLHENQKLKKANEILKGCSCFFCRRPEEVHVSLRHRFIKSFTNKYTVKLMCEVLNVNESGYYKWIARSKKPKKSDLLLVEIQNIIDEYPENKNYGVDRIVTALKQKGIEKSRSTVYRIMKKAGLLHKRRKPRGITKASKEEQKEENIIHQDFTSDTFLGKVLTDITEIPCLDGKLYVSAALDCYSGQIVALQIRNNMKKELCMDTVKQLKYQYGNLRGIIYHSDRGTQYTSYAFKSLLKSYGMVQSLSSAGKCYDNARMESFFATLKKELIYQNPTYMMKRSKVKKMVTRYIYFYYNTRRVNSFNPGGWPPVTYRKLAELSVA